MAIFIAENILNLLDPTEIIVQYQKISDNVKNRIEGHYLSKRDGKAIIASHFLWKDEKLCEIWYKENHKRKLLQPQPQDMKLVNTFSYQKIPYFYPNISLIINSRINLSSEIKVNELFTPRNLHSLAILWDQILKIPELKLRNLFQFIFTGSLGQASKMVFVIKKRTKNVITPEKINSLKNPGTINLRKEVGSWVIGYWRPSEFFEINVWNCFSNRYKRVIRGKTQQYNKANFTHIREMRHLSQFFSQIKKDSSKSYFILQNQPMQHFLQKIPSNSVDYVITDPPHGDRIPYLELSAMWNSWFQNEVAWKDEIVITDAKSRLRTTKSYFSLLHEGFSQILRILKPQKYFTLMFNSLDDETWNQLWTKLLHGSWKLHQISTIRYSAHSVIQDTRRNALKTDFVFTFQKVVNSELLSVQIIPSDKKLTLLSTEAIPNLEKIQFSLEEYLIKILERNPQVLALYEILNIILPTYLNSGYIFKLSDLIQIIKTHCSFKNGKHVLKK
jgi:hypothetical protein